MILIDPILNESAGYRMGITDQLWLDINILINFMC